MMSRPSASTHRTYGESFSLAKFFAIFSETSASLAKAPPRLLGWCNGITNNLPCVKVRIVFGRLARRLTAGRRPGWRCGRRGSASVPAHRIVASQEGADVRDRERAADHEGDAGPSAPAAEPISVSPRAGPPFEAIW